MPSSPDRTSQSPSNSSGLINQLTGLPDQMTALPRQVAGQATKAFNQQADILVPPDIRAKLHQPFTKRAWIVLLYLTIGMFLGWRNGFSLIGWWTGGLIGFFLLDADHLLDVYFLHPEQSASQKVKQALLTRKWRTVWETLISTAPERANLVLHSVIFETIIVILSIYAVTSSGGLFASALVLAFFLRILSEQIREFMKSGHYSSWFWQIRDPVPHNLQAVFLTTALITFIILTIAAL